MNKYLLGIDLGTSGTKTVLFDTSGNPLASQTVEYPLHQPQNGWAEQDPMDWWNAAVTTIKAVLTDSDVNPNEIAGIGISGQMHGLVMLDESGNVLRNSILWCDGRTGEECKEITQTIGAERLIEITANPALTGFTAGKILWVRKHEPELYAKCKHIMLPKDFIRYKLCNVFATEVSDASGMNLLDITTRKWSDEVLKKLDIDRNLLCDMYESCEITGYVTAEMSAITGLATGTPVVGGAGDNAAAGIGTGVVSTGKAFTTLGTSGVVFAHADSPTVDISGRVHTFCSAVPNCYTVMSCTLAAGLSLKWIRDTFCQVEKEMAVAQGRDVYDIMTQEAKQSPIGANRLLYMPYLMGERSPILDENARGAFIGLSAIHEKKDCIRAVLEGVLYAQKQCLDVLYEMGVVPSQMLACGGGGASPFWRQMMADIYGCPVMTVSNKEGPALGVAILAGVGVGLFPNVETACKKMIHTNTTQEPIQTNTLAYHGFFEIYKGVYPALKETYHNLTKQ